MPFIAISRRVESGIPPIRPQSAVAVMMDPFALCLALGPVGIYLLLLGAVNLARRPLLVTGTRDAAALGIAFAGMIIVGPVQLFFPHAAASQFGPYVWILLIAFYALCIVLVLLLLRPRLVIYNMTVDQFRPVLADLVPRLDREARWAGETLSLPGLGVQLHVDQLALMRNISLVSVGADQNPAGWRKLEQAIGDALSEVEVSRNPRGYSLLSGGTILLLLVVVAIARDPQGVATSFFEMLRL